LTLGIFKPHIKKVFKAEAPERTSPVRIRSTLSADDALLFRAPLTGYFSPSKPCAAYIIISRHVLQEHLPAVYDVPPLRRVQHGSARAPAQEASPAGIPPVAEMKFP